LPTRKKRFDFPDISKTKRKSQFYLKISRAIFYDFNILKKTQKFPKGIEIGCPPSKTPFFKNYVVLFSNFETESEMKQLGDN